MALSDSGGLMNTITHLVALVAGLALTLMLHITPSWGAGTTNSTDNAPQVSTPGGSGGPSKEYTERWAVWEAEWKRAMTAADGDALLCSAEEYLNLTRELTQYITTESNTEDIL